MTSDMHLLELGLLADMIDNGQDNHNAANQQNQAAQNHLIDPSEDAAFREFMQMMTN